MVQELTALMGGDLGADSGELSLAVQPPAVILMAGLQGAGKTTTTGKLARWLSEASTPSTAARPARKCWWCRPTSTVPPPSSS